MAVPIIVLCFHKPSMPLTIDALAESGQFEIHAVTGISQLRPRDTRPLASLTRLPPGPRSDAQVVDALLSLARRTGAEALVPVWADDVAFVVRNLEALKEANPVPVPDIGLLEQLVNKLNFARLLETLGFSSPSTIELVPGLDAQEVINRLGLPLLAKQVISEGGEGITSISNLPELQQLLAGASNGNPTLLQQMVPGMDVALTLLADKGKVFAVMMRKLWFSPWRSRAFRPMVNVEFFQEDWLEELGREFVRKTGFSGIADFDLMVDFESRRVWFLESDPRMMGGVAAAMMFGVNVPLLLVEQTRGQLAEDFCARAEAGHFLSARCVLEWIVRAAWLQPRRGPVRTNLKRFISDPIAIVYKYFPNP